MKSCFPIPTTFLVNNTGNFNPSNSSSGSSQAKVTRDDCKLNDKPSLHKSLGSKDIGEFERRHVNVAAAGNKTKVEPSPGDRNFCTNVGDGTLPVVAGNTSSNVLPEDCLRWEQHPAGNDELGGSDAVHLVDRMEVEAGPDPPLPRTFTRLVQQVRSHRPSDLTSVNLTPAVRRVEADLSDEHDPTKRP
ncbi:hypothetical protein R1flu_013693 [Riccia fluitans]|uniref:Uncharacterized protein n=1 Tax=Riccia fluitans TaxID=41844 RepID=A0ABD1YH53_9MARC